MRSTTEVAPLTPHPSRTTVWGESSGVSTLTCRQVRQLTPDLRRFTFAAPVGEVFHFDPGQFVTLVLDLDGETVERSYSISSPPTRPHLLSLIVKRIPDGVVSPWMHENVRVGTTLQARGPLGAFGIGQHPAPAYAFLSAGSGITPVLSMLRTLADLGSDADVVLVHSARTPADVPVPQELVALAEAMPATRVELLCTRIGVDVAWAGRRGRLDAAALMELIPDLDRREVFSCGPDGFLDAVRAALPAAGVDLDHHHEESFTVVSGPPAPTSVVSPGSAGKGPATGFQVEFVRSGRSAVCAPGQTLLDAAVTAGLRLPSSCGQGMCGTCKATLTSGTVDMQHRGGIRPREIAQDKVLLCCSTPLGDVSVDA